MTIICQISLLFLAMYYVHIKWLVVNFFLTFFLLKLIEYYLLITKFNHVCDLKKILLEFE